MSENLLLPCPFCGLRDRVVEHTASIECKRCNCAIFDTLQDHCASQKWNTRPPYMRPCPDCGGQGRGEVEAYEGESNCLPCDGAGWRA